MEERHTRTRSTQGRHEEVEGSTVVTRYFLGQAECPNGPLSALLDAFSQVRSGFGPRGVLYVGSLPEPVVVQVPWWVPCRYVGPRGGEGLAGGGGRGRRQRPLVG